MRYGDRTALESWWTTTPAAPRSRCWNRDQRDRCARRQEKL